MLLRFFSFPDSDPDPRVQENNLSHLLKVGQLGQGIVGVYE